MKINEQWLKSHDACYLGRRWFRDWYRGEDVEVRVVIQELINNGDLPWAKWLAVQEVEVLVEVIDLIPPINRRESNIWDSSLAEWAAGFGSEEAIRWLWANGRYNRVAADELRCRSWHLYMELVWAENEGNES
jgi:hypothetical protein